MFGSNKKQARAEKIAGYNRDAAAEDKKAREHAKKIAGYKKSLKSGSSDPAGLRYLIRESEEDMRGAQIRARDARQNAEQTRKWRL